MSEREVFKSILDFQMKDERVQTNGNCRYAAQKMFEIAKQADRTPPHTEIEIVKWSSKDPSSPKDNVHFALSVIGEKRHFIFNPSPTVLFPRYNGPFHQAPGFLKAMKPIVEQEEIK